MYSHLDISSIEQAGKTESGTERETDGEVSIEEETACERRRKSEKTEYLLDKEMKCRRGWHVPAPATSIKHNTWTLERGFYLAILGTCRQVYAEASPLLYSMVEVIIPPKDVVDLNVEEEIIEKSADAKRIRLDFLRHFRDPDYTEGIFQTLGLASLFDCAAFSRVERIFFHADYNFSLIKDSPSLYIDSNFQTYPNNEAEFISFIKRTRTVENLVSLLATLPRLNQLRFTLDIKVKPQIDLSIDAREQELYFYMMGIVNERATELFIEYGILDPLRKLSNVQNFDFEVQTEARTTIGDPAVMVLKPIHASIAQELKEAVEHNWVARNIVR